MKKLCWTQRLAIEEGIQAGQSNAQIAREIGVHRATIGREIARNASGRENYRARTADDASWHRQQEAMPKRFLVHFNGVEWLTTLNKRDQIYTYVSRTHLSTLCRFPGETFSSWEASYIRLGEKERFTPDHLYERFRLFPSESGLHGLFFPSPLTLSGSSFRLPVGDHSLSSFTPNNRSTSESSSRHLSVSAGASDTTNLYFTDDLPQSEETPNRSQKSIVMPFCTEVMPKIRKTTPEIRYYAPKILPGHGILRPMLGQAA